MNMLVTGKGSSGSWKIRGEQLGKALGATVLRDADLKTMSLFSSIFFVKRVSDQQLARLRASTTPWIWDVVDAWPQPVGNAWNYERCVEWLRTELKRLRPDGVVFPTSQMQQDASWYTPTLVLPHHANPAYLASSRPVSQEVRTVGYEGAHHYLGKWLPTLRKECDRRGWILQMDQPLYEADIVVALRDTAGYACQNWKSNVKLANAQALGVPAICSAERGYAEFSHGAEHWVENPSDLSAAFDAVEAYEYRLSLRPRMHQDIITASQVASTLHRWMRECKFS